MTPLRVLLVDDSPTFLASATEFLAHDPRVAIVGRGADGREAVHLVRELRPDLVLMDATMPFLDGFLATRIIKEMAAPPQVFIVTLHDIPLYRRAAAEAGADGYVAKSEFTPGVIAAIDQCLVARHGTRPPGTDG